MGAPLDPDKVDIFFDDVHVVRKGQGIGPEKEDPATAVMKKGEYTVRINLHRGNKRVFLFTTDFSYDYVKINASYRS